MLALLLLAALAAALAGCGGGAKKDEHAPAACREVARRCSRHCARRPAKSSSPTGAPISDCLIVGAEEGELADLGEGALAAATKLNAAARAAGGGQAGVELGYLIGRNRPR